MAKLPGGPHSWRATEIKGMIAEGRVEEALQKLAALLKTGTADKAVQALAARWILALGIRPGDAKALRDGKPAHRQEWISIAEMVLGLQDGGASYAAAVHDVSNHFGYSERHVEQCVADYNAARATE